MIKSTVIQQHLVIARIIQKFIWWSYVVVLERNAEILIIASLPLCNQEILLLSLFNRNGAIIIVVEEESKDYFCQLNFVYNFGGVVLCQEWNYIILMLLLLIGICWGITCSFCRNLSVYGTNRKGIVESSACLHRKPIWH